MSKLLLTLGLLGSPAALAQEAEPPPPKVLRSNNGKLLVGILGSDWTPGQTVAVYLADPRLDPRTGELIPGLRYGGDARITWVGLDMIELHLAHPAPIPPGTVVSLGTPRSGGPTAAYQPRKVAAAPVPEIPAPEPIQEPAPPPPPPTLPFYALDLTGQDLGSLHDTPAEWPQSVALEGGFTGDGYGTGAGWGAVEWSVRPALGPGQVEIRLEGLRGERWVQGKDDEPHATEPAIGYWLLARVDSPGVGVGVFAVLGAGVDDVGPTAALGLGARTGHPDHTRIELSWDGRGRMGNRFVLDGRVALNDSLRVGMRARVGTLPEHQGDFLQWRADSAVVIDARVRGRWTLQGAIGAGGYDLPWRDLGLVADGRVEVRW
jgi:YD repeat-containing protein